LPEIKPPAEVQRSAVIGGNAHQASWKDMDKAHWLDQDESATGLFFKQGEARKSASKFGIDGLDQEAPKANADGTAYKVFTQPALMSPTKIDSISPALTQGDYQSSVKLNVQVSQIPEVPTPLTAQDALDYTSTVMAAGAAAVRKTEHHMTEPNAINSDVAGTLDYISHPLKVYTDAQSALSGLMDQIDKPMRPEQRAKMAGEFLPLFFFEGEKEPIDANVAKQMNLENMTEEQLKGLNIHRRAEPLEKDIFNPIDRQASTDEKIRQLQALSAQNRPLVEDFLKQIDTKLGTESEISFKAPEDIAAKANRPAIKDTKEWFDVEHVRDALRFRTPVQNLNELPSIVRAIKEAGFEIVKPDLDKLLTPKGRGWRMAAFDLRAPNGQIIEYQVVSQEMNAAGKIEHSVYKGLREKDVNLMAKEELDAKREADMAAANAYASAQQAYLTRTGQTEKDIERIIEETRGLLF
jgi:hypothetical protein